ncbi:mitochondrial ornithine transporter 1 [Lingula anatina]|uniref:Mitochondrial ornithine transporter 1 n=1 Tax=Lingula anatina TaxID=7574 RepID=A0A1S3JEG2_LINAN|nr:mitochondrial ornithine transporter 1 [Lingula anatina]|eukprot:XP_013408805.1 mitochondrial ornithine transporter 1 [Lingula anatina]
MAIGKDLEVYKKDPSVSRKAVVNGIAGGAAGMFAVTAVHPLDTLKTKMQTFPDSYRHSIQCFRDTFHSHGVRGLYHGLTPMMLGNMAKNMVVFMFYGICEDAVKFGYGLDHTSQMTPGQKALAGGLGGFATGSVLCPMELLKCRLQTQHQLALDCTVGENFQLARGPVHLAQQVLQLEGLRGLFVGLNSTLLKYVPGQAIYFGVYESMRSFLAKGDNRQQLSPVSTMVSGALAGMAFYTVMIPVDAVKSRIQVNATTIEPMKFVDTIMKIYKNEGVRPLYRGLGPALLRTAPGNACHFLMYEWVRQKLFSLTGG